MTAWPFRSRLRKAVFVAAVAIMLVAALVGLVSALIAGEFSGQSIAALTVGLGALLIIAGIVLVELVSRKYHPESGLFTWSDVDNLRELAGRSSDAETRSWARSLADRIAVVLPGRRAT
jgi:cytochrome c biogenesis protein CcdA